jgi:tetratricopeptide (TPR) repeat protein
MARHRSGLAQTVVVVPRRRKTRSTFMAKNKGARRPDTLDAEGSALQHQGKHREALELHQRALKIDPKYAPAHHNLGNALLGVGEFVAARESFERAIEIAPRLAPSYNGRGVAFHRLGDLDSAIAAFREALSHNPNFGEAANNLGVTLRERGDMEEAIRWLEHAIACEPKNGRYLRHLVDSVPVGAASPLVARTVALASIANELASESRIEALFAHGKVMLDLGRVDEAFASLDKANALKRHSIPYDETGTLRGFEQLTRTFTRELFDAVRGCGNPSNRPIFIVGMPRSGTTLVETMLAAHPSVRGGGELTTMEQSIAHMPPIHASSTIGEMRAALHAFGTRYLDETAGRAGDAAHLTDKMPFNFRFVPMIHMTMPNARVIHIQRNPLDVALSCYATYFVDNVPFSYDLHELGRYYRGYEKLMAAWRAVLPSDAMLEISYEELVAGFEAHAKRILAYCNLEWDPNVLEFHRFRHPVRSASQSQVRRPLYASSVGRAERSRAHLQPFLDALNG